jgi:hypothetical protein
MTDVGRCRRHDDGTAALAAALLGSERQLSCGGWVAMRERAGADGGAGGVRCAALEAVRAARTV